MVRSKSEDRELRTAPASEKRCLVCRSPDPEAVFRVKGDSYVRCRRCGLIFQDPLHSVEENRHFYSRDYYRGFAGLTPSIQQARLALYQSALRSCAGYRLNGRLLDVGSGYGDFLKMAEEEDWEIWGIEPSPEACQAAGPWMGSRLLNQPVEEVHFPPDHFDVITLWNVIDCFPDPAGLMRKMGEWLRPGGLLLIRTPNALFHIGLLRLDRTFGPLWEKMGRRKEPFVFHQVNYSPAPLRKLLSDAGFSGIRIRNAKPSRGDPYQVLSASGWMAIGKRIVYGMASLISLLSGHRILTGASLLAQVTKEDCKPGAKDWKIQFRIGLKSAALHLLAVAGYILLFPLWFKWLGRDRSIRVLLYHSVGTGQKGDMSVDTAEFERQLDFLTRHYDWLPLGEAVDRLQKGELPRRSSVAVTFDDGYADNHEVVFPILTRRNLKATVFLLSESERQERKALHLGEDPLKACRLLSWDEVREMAVRGISFGSHGDTHVRLKDLSPELMKYEIFSSKARIESEIGRLVRFFSYPYGTSIDFDPEAEALVQKAGYEAAFSKIFGTNTSRTNLFAIKRIGIEASDTLFTFRAKLNGALGLLSLFDIPWVRSLIRRLNALFSANRPPRDNLSVRHDRGANRRLSEPPRDSLSGWHDRAATAPIARCRKDERPIAAWPAGNRRLREPPRDSLSVRHDRAATAPIARCRKDERPIAAWPAGNRRLSEPPILLVSVDFPPHTDGVSTISRELSRRVAGKGRNMLVIGPQDRDAGEFDASQDYRVFRVPGYRWGYLRFLPILICMPWVILRHRVRKVFAMNIAYGGILSWVLSYFLPLEYLIFAYGYEFEKVKKIAFARSLYLSIYARAKRIVCCSRQVRERLMHFGVPAEKIEVLYPAVDLDLYRPGEVPDSFLSEKGLSGHKILLTVGRLIERKGHDQVLRALPRIAERVPNILYCIVGIGPHEKALRDKARMLQIENHVRFMGKVPDQELSLLYNACEIFVMPSREILEGGHVEGFGIVYLEANACGKPVIAGNSGGVAEAVRDGVSGFLVDPHSSEEIAEKSLHLLRNPQEAERLGENGLGWVRETFSWEHYVKEAYRYLCGEELP